MSKPIARVKKRAHKELSAKKVAAVRESRVVLFGSPNDIDVKESIRKAEISGRATEVVPRPGFDTGVGLCGKHLCSCKGICKEEYSRGAFSGDQGATMGMSY